MGKKRPGRKFPRALLNVFTTYISQNNSIFGEMGKMVKHKRQKSVLETGFNI